MLFVQRENYKSELITKRDKQEHLVEWLAGSKIDMLIVVAPAREAGRISPMLSICLSHLDENSVIALSGDAVLWFGAAVTEPKLHSKREIAVTRIVRRSLYLINSWYSYDEAVG